MSPLQDTAPTAPPQLGLTHGHGERLPVNWQSGIGSVDGKVVLITGSTRGIGRAAARAFAERHAQVMVHGRDKARAEGVAAEIRAAGGRAQGYAADLALPDQSRRLVEAIIRDAGSLDILVNNCAILPPLVGPPWGPDDAEWPRVVAT